MSLVLSACAAFDGYPLFLFFCGVSEFLTLRPIVGAGDFSGLIDEAGEMEDASGPTIVQIVEKIPYMYGKTADGHKNPFVFVRINAFIPKARLCKRFGSIIAVTHVRGMVSLADIEYGASHLVG